MGLGFGTWGYYDDEIGFVFASRDSHGTATATGL